MLPFQGRRGFVLLIGDEGALLVERRRGGISVVAHAEGPERGLSDALLAKIAAQPTRAVRPLLDVLEQQYREFDVPSVGLFDLAKVIKRRLSITFPETKLTGAYPVGAGNRSTERRYMAASLPAQQVLGGWLERLAELPNPIEPVALWPVEAMRFLNTLVPNAVLEGTGDQHWRILLSRERVAGFRQVVMQGERLIFTRLTPPIEPDSSPDMVAENIEREFASSLSYLRRLGLTDGDLVDLVVVAEPPVVTLLKDRPPTSRRLHCYTPAQLAARFGVRLAMAADEGHADLLLAGWFARNPGPRLAIDTDDFQQQRIISRAPRATNILAAAVFGVAVAFCTWQEFRILDANHQIAERQSERATYNRHLKELEKEVGALPVEADQLSAALQSYAKLEAASPSFAPKLATLAGSLDAGMAVTKLTLKLVHPQSAAASAFGPNPHPNGDDLDLTATIRLTGPFATRDEVARRIEEMLTRLKASLPAGYTVRQTRDPFTGPSSSHALGVDTGRDPRSNLTVDTEIRVTGPSA